MRAVCRHRSPEAFGLRPGHEHTLVDDQLEIGERRGALDVLQGLSGDPSRHQIVYRPVASGHCLETTQLVLW